MKILIVNQPLNNRGDEAAHKSLIRSLSRDFCDDTISVLFQGKSQNSIDQIKLNLSNVTYVNLPNYHIRGITRLENCIKKIHLTKFVIVCHFNFNLIKIINIVRSADLVICAPGGICMGIFRYWEHLYWLIIAKKLKKKIAYYSRSFGPFPENNNLDKYFNKLSFELLDYFDFISIRDSETMKIADSLMLKYVPSIDTAFLDTPIRKIPDTLKKYLNNPYIIFVPNSLTWHPAYRHMAQDDIDIYYTRILMIIKRIYIDYTIVMLPQIYNDKYKNDKIYFQSLKEKANCENVIVLDDTINSDVQQTIIAGSKFVIGSRYHSIVFAINNNKPVLALSYEHKIAGLLHILDMKNSLVYFDEVILSRVPIMEFEKIIEKKMAILQVSEGNKKQANEIAVNCMQNFFEKYKNKRTL